MPWLSIALSITCYEYLNSLFSFLGFCLQNLPFFAPRHSNSQWDFETKIWSVEIWSKFPYFPMRRGGVLVWSYCLPRGQDVWNLPKLVARPGNRILMDHDVKMVFDVPTVPSYQCALFYQTQVHRSMGPGLSKGQTDKLTDLVQT